MKFAQFTLLSTMALVAGVSSVEPNLRNGLQGYLATVRKWDNECEG